MRDMSQEEATENRGAPSRSPMDALTDIPTMLRGVLDSFVQLGQARMDLATAELKAEFEQRIKRLVLVIVPVCFILTALGLVNLGLVAWLAEGLGPVAASFILAGAYGGIGLLWLLWWKASGGLNPPDEKDDHPGHSAPRGGDHR